jgi:arylsulfatase A-like enzyme
VAAARSLYDAEIAIADGAVARIVAAARAAVRTPSALLINVVADHGEALGERQASRRIAFGHGTLVYDEVVKVPWIVVREGVIGPGVIHTPVSLVDVAATLIALVDPATSFGGEGRSLADSVLSGREPDPAPIVVERRLFASPPTPELGYAELAWIDYPWKIIANEGAKTPELYRLDTDPGELRDLATVEPEQLRRLRGALDAWKQRHPLPERGVAATHARGAARRGGDEAGKAERQEREALRSLGYID